MPRHTRKEEVFRVRTKHGGLFTSYLVLDRTNDKAASKAIGGRIVSVSKVSPEELTKTGEFFTLGDQLMKEFRLEDRKKKEEKYKKPVYGPPTPVNLRREVVNG